jgi:hypothetical protein
MKTSWMPVQEASKPDDEPKKIGYKLFKDGKEAANYYRTLLNALTQRQNLNEVRQCESSLRASALCS